MSQNENRMYIVFPAIPENERMARMIAAAFITNMNPTIEELDDVKTAVSEAVTNCVIHAYRDEEKKIQKKNMEENSGKQNDDILKQKVNMDKMRRFSRSKTQQIIWKEKQIAGAVDLVSIQCKNQQE